MNDCHIHIFSKRADLGWVGTIGAIKSGFPHDTVRVFFDLGKFMRVCRETRGPLVVILAPRNGRELNVLGRIQDCMGNRDVLMIVPGSGVPDEASSWFRPKFLLAEPVDAATLLETVRNMIERELDRHRWREAAARGKKIVD